MPTKLIPFLLFVTLLLSGCEQKCQVICGTGIAIAAVGYQLNELNDVTINIYTPNDSFNNLVRSITVPLIASNPYPYVSTPNWASVSSNDTLWDAYDHQELYVPYDIEIIVSSGNKTYRFSEITFGGPQSENQYCREGTPYPGNCSRHISSYMLNGTLISFNPPNIENGIYFQK